MATHFCPLCSSRRLKSWLLQFVPCLQKSELSDPGKIDTWWEPIPGSTMDVCTVDVTCTLCGFRATGSFFRRGVIHPTPKQDDKGWYIEVFPKGLPGAVGTMFSSMVIKYYLDTECTMGAKYFKLLNVANAQMPEELPEYLVADDESLRLFAKKRLETLVGRQETINDVSRRK